MKTTIILTNQDVNAKVAEALDSQLSTITHNTKIIIDLSTVQNISKDGIGVIISAIRTFKKVVLKGCNASIFNKIDMLGITQLITLKP